MNQEENILQFTLLYSESEYAVRTYRQRYYSLMSLISEHLAISGFGLCSGMGSCETCLVDISEKSSRIRLSVLSCEVQLNDDLENAVIGIVSQGK